MNTLKLRLLLAAVWSCAASASALTLTLNPAEDAFVSSANPAGNYGSAGALGAAAAGLSKGEFDSLLKFDFSTLKTSFDITYGVGQWTIGSITLRFTATPPGNVIFNGNLAGPGSSNINTAGSFALKWMANDSWIEGNGTPALANSISGAITFATLPNYLGGSDEALGTFSFSGATSGNTPAYSLGLTTAFKADATAGNMVSLLLLPADGSVAMLVNSRNNMNAANFPLLSVTATPEPGATTLLAGAALAWFARRRRPMGAA
jgi:hypothetical protein